MTSNAKPALVLFRRGLTHYQAGRLDEARACWERAIAADPALADAHHGLGLVALQRGEHEQAMGALRTAIRHDDSKAGYFANLAIALRRSARLQEALRACDRAIALAPDQAATFNNRGNVHRDLGDSRAALADYARAIALQPDYAEAHYNRGLVLQKAGLATQALEALAEAVRLRPEYPEAWNARGNVLRDLGRWDDARAEYDRALASTADMPGSAQVRADLQYNRAAVRRDSGDSDGAIQDLEGALALKPDYREARWALAFASLGPVYADTAAMAKARALADAGLDALDRACRGDGAGLARWECAVGASQPFYLAYHEGNHREFLVRHGALACDVMGAWRSEQPSGPVPPPRGAGRRVRVGIVSSQVHRHSVWDVLTRGIVTQLDRGRFEVCCYHVGWRRDRETAVARRHAQRFVMGPRPLADWVQRIARDAPDVLIYPEIGMDPLTAKLAGLRLAPLQCTTWGHPMTSGMPTMDVFLGADRLEPPDAQAHYSERLVRLPGLGCWFEPLGNLAAGGAAAQRAAPDSRVTRFVCCQQVAKYHPGDDALFVRIAREAGPCRFTFVELARTRAGWQRFRQRLEQAFHAAGLDPARYLEFLPTLPRPEFLALLHQCDVFLDAPAFSGFTTAIQALSCAGLPVVTCEGPFLRQRLAAGILRQIGVTDTVATTRDGYGRVAVQLARDIPARQALRRRIITALPLAYRDDRPIRALEGRLSQVP